MIITMHLQRYFPKIVFRNHCYVSNAPRASRRHLPGIRAKKLKSQQKVMLTEEVWYKKELY